MFRDFEYVLNVDDVDPEDMEVISIDLNGRHRASEQLHNSRSQSQKHLPMAHDCDTPIRVF